MTFRFTLTLNNSYFVILQLQLGPVLAARNELTLLMFHHTQSTPFLGVSLLLVLVLEFGLEKDLGFNINISLLVASFLSAKK